MSQLKLYHSPYSPFSRSVLLLCRHLELDIEVIELDLLEGQHMRPEFTKINPQHCVPTLDDGGFILWESRAILGYLASIKGQSLVPESPREKAIVNQRLYSEMGGVALKYAGIFAPLFEGSTEMDQKKIVELYEIFDMIEQNYFVGGNSWIAGPTLTVADFAYASTIAGLIATGATLDKYPRLHSWYKQCQSTLKGFHDAIEKGAKMFGDWVESTATKGF